MSKSMYTSFPPVDNTFSEPPALAQLFNTYYARLVHFSSQLTGNKENAEDIVQEAFIKYWNQRNEVSPEASAIKSFLYTTVKNASLNEIRHLKVVSNFAEKADPLIVEHETIIHAIIRSEVIGELNRVIGTLPDSCRTISEMGYIQGLKNQEIADALGISINTVKTQKKRALQLLRLRLDPEIFILLLLFFNR